MPNVKWIEVTYDPGATLEVLVLDQETGYILDNADGEFRAAPADSRVDIPEHTIANGFAYDIPGLYVLEEDRAAWLNGAKTILAYESGGNVVVRSTVMNITNDADESTAPATGSFTYQQVIDDANVKLKNQTYQNWEATVLLSVLNDAVQLAVHAAALRDPDQYASESNLALTVLGGNGPYNCPTDMKFDLWIRDDQTTPKKITKINPEDTRHHEGTGRPQGYWIKGRGPAKVYFDLTPDQSRTFVLTYIPAIARAASADLATYVPLDAPFFEPLVQWVTKFAGDIDEYNTMTEGEKIVLMTNMVQSIVARRANPPRLTVRGITGF